MPTSKNLGVDLGTTGGDWLFRQGGLVLGPVPAAQIVEKLYAGDLDGKTEVSKFSTPPQFHRVGEIEFFKVHVAKAEAKQRVEAVARKEEAKSRTGRNVRIAAVALVAVAIAAGTAVGGRYLAIHAPGKDTDELAYADLISVEAPTITRAKKQKEEEDLVEYPGAGNQGAAKTAKADKPEKGEKGTRLASAKGPKSSGGAKMSEASDDPDGMQVATFDQEAINAVVAAKQKTLFPCLAAEAQKKPGLSAKIPIEFVIGNDGRVTKVWVDNPAFKEGSLPECLLRELQKWRFKAYEGERATIGLSFKIGKG